MVDFNDTIYFHGQLFRAETIDEYTSLGLTVDGTNGGLLLGNSHENSGIPVLIKYANDWYRIMGEFEGYEYLLCPGTTYCHTEKLHQLNQYEIDNSLNISTYNLMRITTIDCNTNSSNFKSKFLILDSRSKYYLINKYSTWKHLKTIEKLNRSVRWNFEGNFPDWQDADPEPFAVPLKMSKLSTIRIF